MIIQTCIGLVSTIIGITATILFLKCPNTTWLVVGLISYGIAYVATRDYTL